ncbi:C40 family peptidase [Flagellimonas meridianipacifica]|uniref:SH3 domain-containing protein n=1 Tax=Flagellimonas meridianipacifica TaxID=1080225 RepID=A0A2T0MCZ2_9FLAO|nr:C40 family peptidase [Allomuricauda pacifica]PRX55378.1 SH3 domain-containing protein [Allomuricauda pacifica]
MLYGICPQSIVALRFTPDDGSEMVSQLLYGEHFKILEARKKWSRIRLAHDNCEGWVTNLQILQIPEHEYLKIDKEGTINYATDIISHVCSEGKSILQPIVLGSVLGNSESLKSDFEGELASGARDKSCLIDTALLYLKAPYLKGGKTPFGIDCSGFTQMVYRINGHQLFRDAEQQSKQGDALSFIEESEPGDLAFFDNSEGIIDHVGIILKDNYIIHVYGEVRIDRLDHTGIFNTDKKLYSHQLRVIKKII